MEGWPLSTRAIGRGGDGPSGGGAWLEAGPSWSQRLAFERIFCPLLGLLLPHFRMR